MSLLLTYYGDDFTGSTDALEALAGAGLRAVLFPGIPEGCHQEKFAGYEAIGIAGESRSRGPEWMERSLPPIFLWLRSLGAPIVQYKVCSTFDSAPGTGNIAVAMRIGRATFGADCVPVVVAAPHLRRYVVFGNLFAGAGDDVYRIDRHPTMRHHPITPMQESDLRLHLREQASDSVATFDIIALLGANRDRAYANALADRPDAILFDGLDERTEQTTGAMLWSHRTKHPFAVGSSGLTYALIRHWRAAGLIPDHFSPPQAEAAERVIAVSGSCSPVTEAQIQHALHHGFEGLCTSDLDSAELLRRGLEILRQGKSLVIYSALGPGDLRGDLRGEELGRHLGKTLRQLVVQSGVRRAIIAGGDTSSHAAGRLGFYALTFSAVLAPGSPLCSAHSDEPAIHGLELVLKGGQVGGKDFFERSRKGTT